MTPRLGIAMLGTGFMGRVHSHAWRSVASFFDLPLAPRMRVVGARDRERLEPFAARWGWERATTDWREAISDPEVELVDVGTPNHVHPEQAIAALEAGKSVACEKPLAATLTGASHMLDAALATGQPTYVWFNYRRVPAVALARRLVAEGRIGRIYHVRAAYLQSWGGPSTPLVWRFKDAEAGSGAHGDLNAHIIDMARFITGEEVVEVRGAIEARFVERRALVEDPSRTGESSVDDAVLFLAELEGGGVASFEATRLATGMQNSNRIEVHGERGALRFDFERTNELDFYDASLPASLQGWSRILVTNAEHPWVAAWWPDGHFLGYEHTFTNTAADIVRHLGGLEPEAPLADFADAYLTQRVMEAAVVSARERTPVRPAEVG